MTTGKQPNAKKTAKVHLRDGRDEMNLVEFPFATLSERASGDKILEFQTECFDRELGKRVCRKLTVTGDAKFGLPTAIDEEVYLGLLQLTKLHNEFADPKVLFTRSELIQLMGWKNRDWSYHRIATALNRLTGVRLFYDNAWRDNEKKNSGAGAVLGYSIPLNCATEECERRREGKANACLNSAGIPSSLRAFKPDI